MIFKKLTQKLNKEQKQYQTGMTNPLECGQRSFLDNLTRQAVRMYERKCDVKHFTKLVLSDPENTSHIEMTQEMIKQGKIVDPFEDEKLAQLADNEKFLKDLGLI